MPAVTITTGAAATATAITNATDVAGHISITTSASAGIAATINFGYAYETAAVQVIISPTNAAAATDIRKVYVSSTTTTTFVISIADRCSTSAHTFDYHVIETQTSNATFGAITVTGTNWLVASQSRSESTDVAGIITLTPPNPATTPASVTFPFGINYTVAPIVVITPLSVDAADALNRIYFDSATTTNFKIGVNGTLKNASPYAYSYHIIETQV